MSELANMQEIQILYHALYMLALCAGPVEAARVVYFVYHLQSVETKPAWH